MHAGSLQDRRGDSEILEAGVRARAKKRLVDLHVREFGRGPNVAGAVGAGDKRLKLGEIHRMNRLVGSKGIGPKLSHGHARTIGEVTASRLVRLEERKLRAAHARLRVANRAERLARKRTERTAPYVGAAERRKRATVERVMQRARQRLQRRGRSSGKM